jgi:hypothetical protein
MLHAPSTYNTDNTLHFHLFLVCLPKRINGETTHLTQTVRKEKCPIVLDF